jgi:adenylate cyclase
MCMPPRLSFVSRLVALVVGAVVTSTLLASGLSSSFFYREQVSEIERQGLTVARLLARAAAVADQTPGEVEEVIAQHMVVAATAIAELVAVAEKCGLTEKQINERLTRIDDKTILDEVWVSDEKGLARLHTGHSPDFQFKPSAKEQPQAHEFWGLLTGATPVVIQGIQKREVDNEKFKYVGVAGVDKPRIVEVGYSARYFDGLKEKIGLQRVVDSLLAGDDIDAIFIFDKASRLIVSPKPDAAHPREKLEDAEIAPVAEVIRTGVAKSMKLGSDLSVIAPIDRDDGERLGAALIRLPLTRVGEHIRLQLMVAFAISAITSMLGAALAAWLARRQTAPILAITRAAQNVEANRALDERLSVVAERSDELGQLARVLMTTAQDFLTREKTLDALVTQRTAALEERNSELKRLSERLSSYLSPQVYETLFQNGKVVSTSAQRKKLTILFADVVSFSEIAESLEAEDLTRLLNEFLNEMADIALKHGATIDKYIGDAIMVFFGDPRSSGVKEDATACLLMAMEMLAAARRLDQKWRGAGLSFPLQLRIGINTGYCTVGDFGSEQRMDYTIVGHQVNLAARIEKAASPDSILLSHETWSLVRDQIIAEEQAPIQVKGIQAPVKTHKVIGPTTERPGAVLEEETNGVRVKIDLATADRSDVERIFQAILKKLSLEKTSGP